MVDSRPLRAGIIGGGFMAAVHGRAIRAAGEELISVASSTPERGLAAARELGATASADDAEALIGDPKVDVVHICTPNNTHQRLAELALKSGKHVVCEKPLAIGAVAADSLVQRASAAGRVATVPFVYRYHPMVREARARVQTGSIGRLLHLAGSYLQDWLLSDGDQNWRVDPAAGGPSRAFADIGSHLVDLVEFITGERVEALNAATASAHPTRQGKAVSTEDVAHVLVRMSSGALGTLLVSQVAAGRKNDLQIEIFGSEASVCFEQEKPDILTLGRRSHTSLITRDAASLSPDAARLSLVPAGHPMGYQDAFNAFVRDTYEQVRTGQIRDLPTFVDGARAAHVTAAVLASAESGTWVDVGAVEGRAEAA